MPSHNEVLLEGIVASPPRRETLLIRSQLCPVWVTSLNAGDTQHIPLLAIIQDSQVVAARFQDLIVGQTIRVCGRIFCFEVDPRLAGESIAVRCTDIQVVRVSDQMLDYWQQGQPEPITPRCSSSDQIIIDVISSMPNRGEQYMPPDQITVATEEGPIIGIRGLEGGTDD